MPPSIELLRPHQYLKNSFVLVGPLFSHQWSVATLSHAAVTFVAFCLMASAVYIFNDMADIELDRAHPVKHKRPLASGTVAIGGARVMLVYLVALSLALSALVSWWALALILSYFMLNVLYSWKLKHVVILDVFVISAGFMLRLLAGTLGLGIPPSAWLLLCGMMITLFLGFSKRFSELRVVEPGEAGSETTETRRVLDDYSMAMLGQLISITAACSILSYGFYTVSPRSVELHDGEDLIYTVPFVAYGIFRYLFLIHLQFKGIDVARDLLADRHILTVGLVWVALTFWALA